MKTHLVCPAWQLPDGLILPCISHRHDPNLTRLLVHLSLSPQLLMKKGVLDSHDRFHDDPLLIEHITTRLAQSEPMIVCAGVKFPNGLILVSPRHYSPSAQAILNRQDVSPEQYRGAVEGFVTQKGQFLNRQEAWTLAKANQQIAHPVSDEPHTLYSEHLY